PADDSLAKVPVRRSNRLQVELMVLGKERLRDSFRGISRHFGAVLRCLISGEKERATERRLTRHLKPKVRASDELFEAELTHAQFHHDPNKSRYRRRIGTTAQGNNKAARAGLSQVVVKSK